MIHSFSEVKNTKMKKTEIIDGKITCKKCGNTKELKYFCKRPESNSYRGTCKMCSKGYGELRLDKQDRNQSYLVDGLKECSRCKEIKALSEFGMDAYTRHGFTSNCKVCINSKPPIVRKAPRSRISELAINKSEPNACIV